MNKLYVFAIGLVFVCLIWAYCWCFVFDTVTSRALFARDVQLLVAEAQKNPTNTRYVDELLEKANSNRVFKACYATTAFGELGPAASPRIKEIAALMQSESPYVRREAARSLSKLGPLSAPVLKELEQKIIMDDLMDDETVFAIEALRNIGEAAIHSLPLLRAKSKLVAPEDRYCLDIAIAKLEKVECVSLDEGS